MYADVDGNIGWQAAGRVPVRVGYDGLMPVPASGDYAWKGILPLDDMPGEFNPERGWIASANQMPLPPDWPVAERRISFEWIAPDRYRRVVERLPQLMPHAPADSWALQQDVHSARATRLVALLGKQPRDPANEALALMLGWNGNIDAGSQAAALYELWGGRAAEGDPAFDRSGGCDRLVAFRLWADDDRPPREARSAFRQ
jgi:penicillin amidase